MSTINRTRRSAMLSPLAFALAFGAYAQGAQSPLPQASLATPSKAVASDELAWLLDWLEEHGAA